MSTPRTVVHGRLLWPHAPVLAVVLITRDAAQLLPRTLAAVSWADSILVVDSGSTDGTRELAEKLGARVVLQPEWKGYGPQKSYALSRAEGDWILVLDAARWWMPSSPPRSGASPRPVARCPVLMLRVNFFGRSRPLRPLAASYVDRLFQKGKGRISSTGSMNASHRGPIERLKGELRHHLGVDRPPHPRTTEYAAVAAGVVSGGDRASCSFSSSAPLPPRNLILKGGSREGKTGSLATFARSTPSASAKLWELNGVRLPEGDP
jgi:hypothetical protein